MSRRLKKAILAYARCVPRDEVPTYNRMQQVAKDIAKNFEGCVKKDTTVLGNIYYYNDIVDLVGRVSDNNSLNMLW